MLIIPYPKAKAGINLKGQDNPFPTSAETPELIHLNINVIIGKRPPQIKLKKYTIPCAFP